jgi:ABC-type transport system substrate-binding protein
MRKKNFQAALGSCLGLALAVFMIICISGPPVAAAPSGELVVLVDTLGSEVWGPHVASSHERYTLTITNEHLVTYGRDDQKTGYYPRLAEKWEVSEDGLTWDFYIRKGIQWHDGWGEFTAEDVKYTLELIGSAGSTSGEAKQWRISKDSQVESLTVVSPYHLRIKRRKPNVLLPWNLCLQDEAMVSKKYYEKVGVDKAIKHPIGTGSWRFIEHKPAEYVKFEAVENHWRQTPAFKYLTIKVVPELSGRLAMLKTGEADIAMVPADKAKELKAAGLKIKSVPGSGFLGVQLGGNVLPTREHYDPTVPWVYHQDEPWDSAWNQRALKVRKALFMAINGKAIIDVVYYGEAEPARLQDWPMGTVFNKPEWKPIPYDPEQSKKLLAEAGYPKGFKKPITVDVIPLPTSPRLIDATLAICNDWEAIGIKVKRNMSEWAVVRPFWAGRKSAWRVYTPAWYMEPEPWRPNAHIKHSKGAFLEGFESLEFDKLIEACATEKDFDKRVQATLAQGQYLIDHYIEGGILISNASFATSSKVGKWPIQQITPYPRDFEYITKAK